MLADTSAALLVNDQVICTVGRSVKRGSSAWNFFKDQEGFINTPFYTNDHLYSSLKSIWLLRGAVSSRESSVNESAGSNLKYFVSGRIFRNATGVRYDDLTLQAKDLAFSASLPDHGSIAWGIGFLDNNRNQFRIKSLEKDSFLLLNRYPAYPLSEENNTDWSVHAVNKFLVSESEGHDGDAFRFLKKAFYSRH